MSATRRAALVALVLGSLFLVACGGGGSSSSSGAGTSDSSASSGGSGAAAWTKEVLAVMSRFENHVSAYYVESISTSSSHHLLEPVYRAYAAHLARFAKELEATDAPAACVAVRKKIAGDAMRVSELNGELGNQDNLSETAYAMLVEHQGQRLSKYGSELSKLAVDPNC